MRPAHRKPSPPTHTTRQGRLAPYDRAAERQAKINLDLFEGMIAITQAGASLSSYMYAEVERDSGAPDAHPLNIDAA